jgi:hypothetical protein
MWVAYRQTLEVTVDETVRGITSEAAKLSDPPSNEDVIMFLIGTPSDNETDPLLAQLGVSVVVVEPMLAVPGLSEPKDNHTAKPREMTTRRALSR